MHIAILMSVNSPWSRQTALRFCELGHRVMVVDFQSERPGAYLSAQDEHQRAEVTALRERVARWSLLATRWRSRLRYVVCGAQLKRACRDFGAGVLLSLYGGGFATLGYLSGVRPYVVYVVGTDILRSGFPQRWITPRVLHASAAVVANGQYLAERTRAAAPRSEVIPLVMGVDTQRFAPRPSAVGPVKVLCTRGFLPVYNNESIVQALAEWRTLPAELQVVFTSAGPSCESVRRLAAEGLPVALQPRVVFAGGVSDDAMLEHLQTAQVFVSMSRSDGTSISLLEALACGLFPVLSDIPQNREWVDPRLDNGILVPLDQPAALAEALRRAVTDGVWRARAAAVNQRLILARADSRVNMAVLARRLETIVHHHQRHGGCP